MSTRRVGARRGLPLTVLLVIFTLFEVAALGLNFLAWRRIVTHGQDHPEIPVVAMILLVVALVALVGVWLWQRKAVYLLAAAVAADVIFDAVLGLPSLALLIRLMLIAALGWCIRQRWASFR